ncbi:imidazolonepropionase [Ferrimonas marina]|uniref:Imidazolonepropionase n=1 Tax=Ferrimonas marina TaxID=299255 RepID=A0A1M5XND6_9GAMM|nr:imidazolonepropionase [Ferrimonas marina]SHI01276.1 imidazolonepropionase [Ferrimonas marina]
MDWDELWLDVNIATLDPAQTGAYGAIKDGAVAIKDGKIAWIGPRQQLPEIDPFALPIQRGNGGWLTPGLVDCHTHLLFGGSRAREFELRLEGASYETIARQGGGILSTVAATRAADEEQLFHHGRKRLNALLREGVTTVEIKSGYGLELATEQRQLTVARELGRVHPIEVHTTFLGAHALPTEFQHDGDGYIDDLVQRQLPTLAQAGLVDAVDAFCENIGFSPEQTERLFQAAQALGLPVKLHAEQLSNQGGSALAARYQALSVDHLEWLDEAGVKALADSGTVAVLLPGAFYCLRETRLPPIELLRQYGVPMAVASDYNPGSSPLCSSLLMLNMACTQFRLTPEEALTGLTRHGAQALGQGHRIGHLAVGMDADMVLWDIESPAELAWQYGTGPCLAVIKAGAQVHRG